MNALKKFIFFIKKPRVIIVAGNERFLVADIIFQIFKSKFKTRKISDNLLPLNINKNEILIFTVDLTDSKNLENYKFLLKKSRLSVILLCYIGETPSEINEKPLILEQTSKMVKFLPPHGFIIISLDDGIIRRIKSETTARLLTYGFQEGADFWITDLNISGEEANFKINHEGDIVPIWLARQNFAEQNLGGLEKLFGKEQIYSVSAAIAIGVIFDLNLVEISQALKNYHYLSKI